MYEIRLYLSIKVSALSLCIPSYIQSDSNLIAVNVTAGTCQQITLVLVVVSSIKVVVKG